MSAYNIFFIGGTGRCGTDVLKEIISKHSSIASIKTDLRFIIEPDGIIQFYNTFLNHWSPYNYDISIRRLEKMLKEFGKKRRFFSLFYSFLLRTKLHPLLKLNLFPPYMDSNLIDYCKPYSQLVDQLIYKLTTFRYSGTWVGHPFLNPKEFIYHSPINSEILAETFRRFIDLIIREIIREQHADKFLEANDWNILYFDKLLEIFPESKLLHIYRDPRDVVASYIQQRWSPDNAVDAAIYYNDVINRWFKIKNQIHTKTYFEISLEQLVNNTEETLKKSCDFLQIDWDEKLLHVDLSRSHTGRWKNDLTKVEQEKVRKILDKPLRDLKYIQ